MNYLLDSQTLFDFLDGHTELFHLFDNPENLYVNAISQGELFSKAYYKEAKQGFENKNDFATIAMDFCSTIHRISCDEYIARKFGELKIKYPEISNENLWVVATAIVRDFVIVSSSEELAGISEIVVKNFYK